MTGAVPAQHLMAVRDFHRARRKAALRQILARLGLGSADLLSYDEVRRELLGRETGRWELREIPLDSIVGSVGRYKDFTRDFMPRRDSDADRWAGVKVAMTGLGGLPPIEVYQVGEAYFVFDGNHRVSVARSLGATHIEAYVNRVKTKVDLTSDVRADDLIMKADFARFLQLTNIDAIRPASELAMTVPGRYEFLAHQIRASAGLMEQSDRIPSQAVKRWYEERYLPLVELIREYGLLREFPGRTETDLYVWISQHRSKLEQSLGWEVKPELAAADLAERASPRLARLGSRLRGRLMKVLPFDGLQSGPRPGAWRHQVLERRRRQGFTLDILIPISGRPAGWNSFDQAELVARREGARLLGLHVVATEEAAESETAQSVKTEFQARCDSISVECRFAIDVGDITKRICERARWSDLMVLKLDHPPSSRPIERLGSGFRTLVQSCPRPILAVPAERSTMQHALLAYDGSPKSQEALYLATYLVGSWGIALTVLTVPEGKRISGEALQQASEYLEGRQVEHEAVFAEGEVVPAIMQTASMRACDFILLGGYGHRPLIELVVGSTVDELLRVSQLPALICR